MEILSRTKKSPGYVDILILIPRYLIWRYLDILDLKISWYWYWDMSFACNDEERSQELEVGRLIALTAQTDCRHNKSHTEDSQTFSGPAHSSPKPPLHSPAYRIQLELLEDSSGVWSAWWGGWSTWWGGWNALRSCSQGGGVRPELHSYLSYGDPAHWTNGRPVLKKEVFICFNYKW